MKFFSVILSLYIIALTLFPCVDVHVGDICNRTEISSHNHNNTEKEHVDCCTPFCACSCCSMAVELQHSFLLNIIRIVSYEITSIFPPQFPSSFSAKIWQPPRV